MVILKIIFVIVVLMMILGIIDIIKKFYLRKYEYNIYRIQVLLVLFLAFTLFLVFLMGLDGLMSYDNMIVAGIVGIILWVLVLIYNIKETSFIFGILLTIFQSIIGMFLVFLLILFVMERDGKRKLKI